MRTRHLARLAGLALAGVVVAPLLPAAAAAIEPSGPQLSVIVREAPGAGDRPERAVELFGGTVGTHIALIDGFEATVPAGSTGDLERTPGVVSVTENRPVQLAGGYDGFSPKSDFGSMYYVAQEVSGAGEYWGAGYTGQGVDVALIDSGVVAVDGLRSSGKVMHGPDLSFESQVEDRRHLDTFGHGTHMAGIIAGRDDAASFTISKGIEDHFLGMAPDARIVSVKVADAHGATDVSQVLAGIDWVVANRNRNGLNIRVLNLSFGTDSVQDYRIDPLAYAVEVAWRHGIVVVVAAGNRGLGSEKLNDPAYDPFVIAVGGADGKGTYGVHDDVVGDFSSRGDATRAPDLVAPGKSIVSLRAPGSSADIDHPGARVGTRQFRGTGTSQAAAVVTGAVALIVEQRPSITPDQVKELLTNTATRLPAAETRAQGAGMVNLKEAKSAATPSIAASAQPWAPSTGLGSLDASRGTADLVDGGVVLTGERDIHGSTWSATTWSTASMAGTAWNGGSWNGTTLAGTGWSGNRWTSVAWTGNRWSGNRWTGDVWTGNRWTGNRWTGESWAGNRWTGNRWTGDTWSSAAWGG